MRSAKDYKDYNRKDHNRKKRIGKNDIQRIYVLLVTGVLALGGLGPLILPDRTYSAMENRYLTACPGLSEISAETVLSGELQNRLSEAAGDQFPFRNVLMRVATTAQYAVHPTEVNDVYIGKHQTLFQKVTGSDLSRKNYESNLNNITGLKAMRELADVDLSVMLIPSPGFILSEQLPKGAVLYDSDAYYESGAQLCEANSVRWIDTREALMRAKDHRLMPLYFSTDHHWTAYGAYEGAAVYLQTQHQTLADLSEFELTEASDDFYGTIYSRVPGLPFKKPDTLELPEYLPEGILVETSAAPADAIDQNGEKTMPVLDGIYDRSKLTGKDQYAVYFGGNYSFLTINNPNPQVQGRRLLIIKDSYANSMVPYLIPYYEQIMMIDLRYYNEDLEELLKVQQPQEILFCYEMSNFINDRNILKILR